MILFQLTGEASFDVNFVNDGLNAGNPAGGLDRSVSLSCIFHKPSQSDRAIINIDVYSDLA
jgi:hypothetical protein